MKAPFTCTVCHQTKTEPEESCTTGYGTNDKGEKVCFACCGIQDKADMLANGRATMYLVRHEVKDDPDLFQYFVTNWPGTLKIRAPGVRHGRHNIARTRTDVWFKYEGKEWHGVTYGENTQICHVRAINTEKDGD